MSALQVAVIVPCQNVGASLPRALDSIFAQTLCPDEVICLNDNSTDDTVHVLRRYSSRVRVIEGRWNNAAAARNEGARLATSSWLAFLDGDDLWYPHHLATAARYLAASDCDLCVTDYDRVTYGTTNVEQLDSPMHDFAGQALGPLEGYEFALTHPGGLPTASMVVHRDAFHRVGGFDESQLRRHDIDLFMRLVLKAAWTYGPVATWRYWAHRPGSIGSARGSCAYFTLRMLLGAAERLPTFDLQARIQDMACATAAYALIEANPARRDEMLDTSLPHLPAWRRRYYQCTRTCPALGNAIRRGVGALRDCVERSAARKVPS